MKIISRMILQTLLRKSGKKYLSKLVFSVRISVCLCVVEIVRRRDVFFVILIASIVLYKVWHTQEKQFTSFWYA